MSLFLVAFVVMACWFAVSCAAGVLLYAACHYMGARRRRALERMEQQPLFPPANWELSAWEMDVTERRT